MQSTEERLALLEEAHVQHRQAMREMRGLIARLYQEIEITEGSAREMGPGGPKTFARRVTLLERGGLSWTTQEALRAVERLSKLADAMSEIFDDGDSNDR